MSMASQVLLPALLFWEPLPSAQSLRWPMNVALSCCQLVFHDFPSASNGRRLCLFYSPPKDGGVGDEPVNGCIWVDHFSGLH